MGATRPDSPSLSLVSPAFTMDARRALERLLLQANEVLDQDCQAARNYLVRAAAMVSSHGALQNTSVSHNVHCGGLAPWQARRITAYVAEHLGERISAADLAAHVRLSQSHFFRAFRRYFGEAPMSYIMRIRMQRAQQLMLQSRNTLSIVALECGLCDQAHFTRVFRKVVGTTPCRWRRENFDGGPAP